MLAIAQSEARAPSSAARPWKPIFCPLIQPKLPTVLPRSLSYPWWPGRNSLTSLLICHLVLDRHFDVETCQLCSYQQEQSASDLNFRLGPLFGWWLLNFTFSSPDSKMSLPPATCWSFSSWQHVAVRSLKPYSPKISLAIARLVYLTSSCLSSLDS